eukprot:2525456-Pleurochrysis_carterae.AAC.1
MQPSRPTFWQSNQRQSGHFDRRLRAHFDSLDSLRSGQVDQMHLGPTHLRSAGGSDQTRACIGIRLQLPIEEKAKPSAPVGPSKAERRPSPPKFLLPLAHSATVIPPLSSKPFVISACSLHA